MSLKLISKKRFADPYYHIPILKKRKHYLEYDVNKQNHDPEEYYLNDRFPNINGFYLLNLYDIGRTSFLSLKPWTRDFLVKSRYTDPSLYFQTHPNEPRYIEYYSKINLLSAAVTAIVDETPEERVLGVGFRRFDIEEMWDRYKHYMKAIEDYWDPNDDNERKKTLFKKLCNLIEKCEPKCVIGKFYTPYQFKNLFHYVSELTHYICDVLSGEELNTTDEFNGFCTNGTAPLYLDNFDDFYEKYEFMFGTFVFPDPDDPFPDPTEEAVDAASARPYWAIDRSKTTLGFYTEVCRPESDK